MKAAVMSQIAHSLPIPCYAIEPMQRARALTQLSYDRLNWAKSCHIGSMAAVEAARGTNSELQGTCLEEAS